VTSFNGWADAWGNSWGSGDPNEMHGSASFSINAYLTVNTGEMIGGASMTFTATLTLPTSVVTDTHDGYWAKQWEDIAKKSKAAYKLEKKRQKEAEIALAQSAALIAKVKEIKPIESPIVLSESATYLKKNKLIVDRVIESTYHTDNEDEDLLMLW
jgi:hypothetical protein